MNTVRFRWAIALSERSRQRTSTQKHECDTTCHSKPSYPSRRLEHARFENERNSGSEDETGFKLVHVARLTARRGVITTLPGESAELHFHNRTASRDGNGSRPGALCFYISSFRRYSNGRFLSLPRSTKPRSIQNTASLFCDQHRNQ